MEFRLATGGRAGPPLLASLAALLLGATGTVWAAAANLWNGRPDVAAVTSVFALALWWFPGRWLREANTPGTLAVDTEGTALWRAANGEPAEFRPLGWFSGLGLVWIEGEADGRRLRFLLGSGRIPPTCRHGLARWLLWLDRGGAACNTGLPSQSAARAD